MGSRDRFALTVCLAAFAGTSCAAETRDEPTASVAEALANNWSSTSLTNAPTGRSDTAAAVWTGSKMIVWGGFDGTRTNTGGMYDPTANAWTATSTVGAPTGRQDHTMVWTGNTGNPASANKLIVWGGYGNTGDFDTGGVYDPATNTWRATATAGAPAPRSLQCAVWTGNTGSAATANKMIVWGGAGSQGELSSGGIYDPVTNTWDLKPGLLLGTAAPGSPVPTASYPAGAIHHTCVWTGSKMIAFGGYNRLSAGDNGGVYDPATDAWLPLSPVNRPHSRAFHTAVWTGSRMLVWGGYWRENSAPFTMHFLNDGALYDPGSSTWTVISSTNAPAGRSYPKSVWTGSKMIVWGGSGETNNFNTGGRYDVATNTWSATSTTGAPSARNGHVTTWTGSAMIVWGGWDGTARVRTGGVYTP